jgi:hypothetical protein
MRNLRVMLTFVAITVALSQTHSVATEAISNIGDLSALLEARSAQYDNAVVLYTVVVRSHKIQHPFQSKQVRLWGRCGQRLLSEDLAVDAIQLEDGTIRIEESHQIYAWDGTNSLSWFGGNNTGGYASMLDGRIFLHPIERFYDLIIAYRLHEALNKLGQAEIVGETTIDGRHCLEVLIDWRPAKRWLHRIYLDEGRDLYPVKIIRYLMPDEGTELPYSQWETTEFLEQNGVWFPKRAMATSWDYDSASHALIGSSTSEYNVIAVRVGDIDDKTLSFTPPEGAMLHDANLNMPVWPDSEHIVSIPLSQQPTYVGLVGKHLVEMETLLHELGPQSD